MAIHGTLDLETLDTKPTATVLSLGGVKFNPFNDAEPYAEIYIKIDIDEQDRVGCTVSDSTIKWWSEQDAEVQEEAFSPDGRVSIETALAMLNKWCVGVDEFWGHGYGFDFTILENLYRAIGKPFPWQFWQISDSRTITKRMAVDPRKSMQTSLHNALADAYFQAKSIQIMFRDLNYKK